MFIISFKTCTDSNFKMKKYHTHMYMSMWNTHKNYTYVIEIVYMYKLHE